MRDPDGTMGGMDGEDLGAPPDMGGDPGAGRALMHAQQMPLEVTERPQQAATRYQNQFVTAIAPTVARDPKKALKGLKDEAGLAGREFFYSWSVNAKIDGKSTKSVVEGPTIQLANAAARRWSNVHTTVIVAEEGPDYWVFQATATDLEAGMTIQRLFRQRKGAMGGKYDVERKLDIAFQIGQSKALRNVLVNLLPGWLLKQAVAVAKQAEAKAASGGGKATDVATPQAILDVMCELAPFKVTEDHVKQRCNVDSVSKLTGEQVAMLQGIVSGMKERQTQPEQEFEMGPTAPAAVTVGGAAAVSPTSHTGRSSSPGALLQDVQNLCRTMRIAGPKLDEIAQRLNIDLSNLTPPDAERLMADLTAGSRAAPATGRTNPDGSPLL